VHGLEKQPCGVQVVEWVGLVGFVDNETATPLGFFVFLNDYLQTAYLRLLLGEGGGVSFA